jgi:hypothetical protein
MQLLPQRAFSYSRFPYEDVEALTLPFVYQDGTAGTSSPVDAAQHLAADVTTSFPDADIFGVKLVNGRPTKAFVEVTNRESAPIQLALVGGALHATAALPDGAPEYQSILRNLSVVQYNLQIEPGEKKAVSFPFALDAQPQDVRLQLFAVLANDKGVVEQVEAHNAIASIVEAPTSFLDPQMYAPFPRPPFPGFIPLTMLFPASSSTFS